MKKTVEKPSSLQNRRGAARVSCHTSVRRTSPTAEIQPNSRALSMSEAIGSVPTSKTNRYPALSMFACQMMQICYGPGPGWGNLRSDT